MRRLRPVAAVVAVCAAGMGPAELGAQVSLQATLGVRYTSSLVRDSIVEVLSVRPDLAPTLVGTVGLPLRGAWRLELLMDVSTSPVRQHDASGSALAITRLWMLAAAMGLRRQVLPWLSGQGAIGAMKYVPTKSVGLFAQGGGSLAPFASLSFSLAPPAVRGLGVAVELAGDVSRFQTPALRNGGFAAPRLVYRLMAGVRARMGTIR